MSKALVILALAATTGACAGMIEMPKKRTLEQEAISIAVHVCKRMGHVPDQKEFTTCTQNRYEEYINHRR